MTNIIEQAVGVEAALAAAAAELDPLVRLAQLSTVARRIDALRSECANAKGAAAVACTDAGVTQRAMADASGVKPAMVQQWVRRGRGLPPHRHSTAT